MSIKFFMVIKKRNQVAFYPDDKTLLFIEESEKKGFKKAELLEVAMKFFMAWPDKERYEVIGRAKSGELEEYIEDILDVYGGGTGLHEPKEPKKGGHRKLA